MAAHRFSHRDENFHLSYYIGTGGPRLEHYFVLIRDLFKVLLSVHYINVDMFRWARPHSAHICVIWQKIGGICGEAYDYVRRSRKPATTGHLAEKRPFMHGHWFDLASGIAIKKGYAFTAHRICSALRAQQYVCAPDAAHLRYPAHAYNEVVCSSFDFVTPLNGYKKGKDGWESRS